MRVLYLIRKNKSTLPLNGTYADLKNLLVARRLGGGTEPNNFSSLERWVAPTAYYVNAKPPPNLQSLSKRYSTLPLMVRNSTLIFSFIFYLFMLLRTLHIFTEFVMRFL